jgi:cell division protein FtsQ
VISLARLATDRELEARTVAGTTVVFGARGDFFRQLAKLDYLWDSLASAPGVPARIDLTLGREIPVMIPTPPAQPAVTGEFPPLQSKTRREL